MSEEVSFHGSIGTLKGVVHGSSPKAVILCHGFTGSKGNKAGWAEELAKDFTVLRFDFSGHGESDGKLEDITLTALLGDARSAIEFMKKRGAKSVGIAGHSLGGSVTILASPFVKAVCPIEAVTDFSSVSLNRYGLKKFDEDARKHDIYRVIRNTKTPMLFIHGEKDNVVPLWHSQKAVEAAPPGSALEIIKGMTHDIEETGYKQIIALTKDWFKRTL